jgi:transposase InsO family protein
MAQNQQLDVLRVTVPGKLGQHRQNLPQEQVDQRRAHGLDRRRRPAVPGGQVRTSQPPNRIYEPHKLRIAIVTWIERTYHRRRRQRSLSRLTPIEYETIMTPPASQAA